MEIVSLIPFKIFIQLFLLLYECFKYAGLYYATYKIFLKKPSIYPPYSYENPALQKQLVSRTEQKTLYALNV